MCEHAASRLRRDCIVIRTSVSADHPKGRLSKLSILNTRQWKLICLPLPRGMSTHRNELTKCQIRTYDAQFTTKRQGRCRPVELGGHSPSSRHIDVATWRYPPEMLGQFTSKRQSQYRSAVPEGNSPSTWPIDVATLATSEAYVAR